MPHRRFEWHERIKAVEREYWSARRAVDRLSADVARDPSALGEGPSPRDLRSADENLEGTYLVRMFAEFETGVWYMTPSLTEKIPVISREDYVQLCDAIGDLEKLFSRETLPSPVPQAPKCAEDWRVAERLGSCLRSSCGPLRFCKPPSTRCGQKKICSSWSSMAYGTLAGRRHSAYENCGRSARTSESP